MMGLSIQHLLLVLVVALLFFGRGKVSELMGDFAKGIKDFKKGITDEDPGMRHGSPRAIEDSRADPIKPL